MSEALSHASSRPARPPPNGTPDKADRGGRDRPNGRVGPAGQDLSEIGWAWLTRRKVGGLPGGIRLIRPAHWPLFAVSWIRVIPAIGNVLRRLDGWSC